MSPTHLESQTVSNFGVVLLWRVLKVRLFMNLQLLKKMLPLLKLTFREVKRSEDGGHSFVIEELMNTEI